jgi:hypothetical protein
MVSSSLWRNSMPFLTLLCRVVLLLKQLGELGNQGRRKFHGDGGVLDDIAYAQQAVWWWS